MPFRIPSELTPDVRRGLEKVRLILEPTLYAMRFEIMFTDITSAGDLPGGIYPIPYYFDPETGARKKAWQRGSLVIDHMSAGINNVVTVEVMAFITGSVGVVLASQACDLGGDTGDPLTLKRFYSELIGQDLTPYDAIGLSYSVDPPPVIQMTFATTLLWRPSV